MKKDKKETWLDFFKKALKVTSLTLVAILVLIISSVIWVTYQDRKAVDAIGTVYLNCEGRFIAFNDIYLRSQWDGLENDWEVSLDITKKNKRVVEAKFRFEDGEGLYTIDRINGHIELKDLTNNKILAKRDCIKIEKTELPASKEVPKF